ncbi:alpha/beta hydrolase [Rhodopirellula halodulae]|uniref:alpha/beta hydrolase n=1 Tax=Rhodopirellula halodulae TaxID=2894198 RepID=UPI001E65C890|nr:alpha/beta hydrolase [Rhodopirellula sp. JC737]MCC9657755.1 alpha/beta hydrolase [Rhodopirellula sp. JC737]
MPLHPQAQAHVEMLRELNPPRWEDLGVQKARRGFSALKESFGPGPEMHSVEDKRLCGLDPDGVSLEVPVRIYRPTNSGAPQPVAMFFHGGGWVLGDIESHDTTCRRLAAASNAVVVSVDYRRSPETPFPGPLHDCYVATMAVAKAGADLRVDADRMVVVGDSAGGNLAASVGLLAQHAASVNLKYAMLLYPVVTPHFDSASYEAFESGFGLTKRTMKWFWSNYLGRDVEEKSEHAEPLADLLRADFSGFPATHVLVAGYDVLRDEGLALADRMEAAGVSVTRENADDMLHGYLHFAGQFETGVSGMRALGQRMAEALSSV